MTQQPQQPLPPGWNGGPLTPEQERTQSMWVHLAPLVIYLGGGLVTCGIASVFAWIYPLIIMNMMGSRSPRVRAHAVESLNFQLSFLIYNVAAFALVMVLGFATLGLGWILTFPVALALVVLGAVAMGVAGSQASAGGFYRYPLTIRMVS